MDPITRKDREERPTNKDKHEVYKRDKKETGEISFFQREGESAGS